MIPRIDGKITDLLKKSSFTLSAEIVPPRNGVSSNVILNQIDSLKNAGAQFIAVTKGAGGSLRGGSLPIAQLIKDTFNIPCIAHFTCRDLLPEEVENQLVDHHFFGIRNILALRGDPPQGVTDWVPREGSYPYAYQLVEQIRALNEGRYLERSGFDVKSREKTDFCMGVACYPDHPVESERFDFLALKAKAGAEFAISQMIFSPESYGAYIEGLAKRGVNIPILPGTQILKSREQAEKISKRFAIPIPESHLQKLPASNRDTSKTASLDAFLSLAEAFRKNGAPGMHVFVLSNTELAKTALKELSAAVNPQKPQAEYFRIRSTV